ncbi:MAG: ACT domain-containing protein [Candidatus Binatia bacterium]
MHATIELFVRRHPHVLLHVVGLVARRGFHLDGILSEPTDDARVSRIVLFVAEHERLPQLVKQLRKLHDVLRIAEPSGAQNAA